MYLVSLQGKDVISNRVNICVITKMYHLDTIKVYIHQKYNVEFETLSAIFTSDWWCFRNITDDRDIALFVERICTEDDIASLLP